jgi:ADP-heptose:LPS heptosyltransferase
MKLLDLVNKLLFSVRKKQIDQSLGTVLVVSNTGFGDTILSTPAIKTLKKSFVNQRIIFLVNKKFVGLFLNYKYADSIWKYSGGYLNLFLIILKCRINKIHTIMLLHSNGPEDIFFTLLSGARNILKCSDNINHPYKALFFNELKTKNKHNIEKKIDLVRAFYPKLINTEMSISDFFYDQEPVKNIPYDKKVIGIQLGAQDIYKIWPVENVIKLSLFLLSKNYFLLFFGGNKIERQMMIEIQKNINSSNFYSLVGKTKVIELPSMIKRLNLLVTNDTGILHLAIAMKIKTLSLFAPTSSKEFGAYQDRHLHFSIQKNGFFVNDKPKKKRTQEGMKLIEVDEVISSIEKII